MHSPMACWVAKCCAKGKDGGKSPMGEAYAVKGYRVWGL